MAEETPTVPQGTPEIQQSIYEILSMGFSEIADEEPPYIG